MVSGNSASAASATSCASCKRQPGLDRHVPGLGIDLAHAVEADQADDHLLARKRHLAADQPGIARLRDDGDAVLVGPAHQRLHLGDRTRQRDGRGLDVEALARLVEKAVHVARDR